ncbi:MULTISPECIES: Ig-like domain-containing protein [Saccharibacillus]|uniref:Ig-like domain-containing protein n=1 Tax=Saccharibacillus TaxID=456492 RepID=UPI0013662651|nr:Ig-like domain-containing protein [Saccharibacillus sp. WB 17]
MIKKTVTALTLASLLISGAGGTGVLQAETADAKIPFYQNAVDNLTSQGVMTGSYNGSENMNAIVTRGEVATMLANLLGIQGNASALKFSDVNADSSEAAAVAALTEAGYVKGFTDGTFRPDKGASRAEITTLALRIFTDLERQGASGDSFTDVQDSNWFSAAVKQLSAAGVVNGMGDGRFDPMREMTRGEFATIVDRSVNTVNDMEFSVDRVGEGTVTISGKTYAVSADRQALFSAANAAALNKASVKFNRASGTFSEIRSVALQPGANAAETVTIDGKGGTFEGALILGGSRANLSNLTVGGGIEVGASTGSEAGELTFNKVNTPNLTVNRANANVTLTDSKPAAVQLQGSGSSVTTNAELPEVAFGESNEKATLNGKVNKLVVNSAKEVKLFGQADLQSIVLNPNAKLWMNDTAKALEATIGSSAKLYLGANAYLENAVIDASYANSRDAVDNWNRVGKLNGGANPYREVVNAPAVWTPAPSPAPTPAPNPEPAPQPIAVEQIRIDQGSLLTVVNGSSQKLTATVTPTHAADPSITWSSGNPEIAEIDSQGNLKAVGVGATSIKATAGNGVSALILVTVTAEQIAPASVSIREGTELSLEKGKTAALTAVIDPITSTDKSVTWTSDNEAAATVDAEGRVSAQGEGVATITVTTSNGLTASIAVTVTAAVSEVVEVTSVTIEQGETASIDVGTSFELTAAVNPQDATDRSLSWSSSDPRIVSVDPVTGVVTAASAGEAIITVSASNGVTDTIRVTAVAESVPASGIAIQGMPDTLLTIGQFVQLEAIVSPSNATDKSVIWKSEDPTIASVNSTGGLTALKSGETRVLAMNSAGGVDAVVVRVERGVVNPTSISINESIPNPVYVGDGFKLTATISPNDATGASVTWSSSNPNVLTVDNEGNLSAVAAGTASIAVRTSNGMSDSRNVTVYAQQVEADGITIAQGATGTLEAGATQQLTATVTPVNATDKTVTWTSANTAVATVSNTGLVTAVAAGKTTVTATNSAGRTATIEYTVTPAAVQVTVDQLLKYAEANGQISNLQNPAASYALEVSTESVRHFLGSDAPEVLNISIRDTSGTLRVVELTRDASDPTYDVYANYDLSAGLYSEAAIRAGIVTKPST